MRTYLLTPSLALLFASGCQGTDPQENPVGPVDYEISVDAADLKDSRCGIPFTESPVPAKISFNGDEVSIFINGDPEPTITGEVHDGHFTEGNTVVDTYSESCTIHHTATFEGPLAEDDAGFDLSVKLKRTPTDDSEDCKDVAKEYEYEEFPCEDDFTMRFTKCGTDGACQG